MKHSGDEPYDSIRWVEKVPKRFRVLSAGYFLLWIMFLIPLAIWGVAEFDYQQREGLFILAALYIPLLLISVKKHLDWQQNVPTFYEKIMFDYTRNKYVAIVTGSLGFFLIFCEYYFSRQKAR